jgi:hypothetical protein
LNETMEIVFLLQYNLDTRHVTHKVKTCWTTYAETNTMT